MSNVFIPTNPHDKILTDAERQKWESDLDNKKDDFPYIALTKAQLKLLKQARTDAVLITAHNENDADVLCGHSFAYCLVNGEKRGLIARQRGANYLAYAQKENSQAWSITARDCLVAAMCRLLHKSSGENTKIKGGVPNVKKQNPRPVL